MQTVHESANAAIVSSVEALARVAARPHKPSGTNLRQRRAASARGLRWRVHRAIACGALWLASVSAPALAVEGSLSAVHTHGFSEGEIYDSGLILRLEHSMDIGGNRVKAEGRMRWNSARCAAASSATPCDADPLQFDWRELYAARAIGDWEVSAGLQQVVWGRADNLRVLDVINPLDLRDFLLPDLNESRMSAGMLRASGPVGAWNIEALWLPNFKPTRFAPAGTAYDLGIDARFRAAGLDVLPSRRPARDGGSGEFAVRASSTRGVVDVDVIAFNGYNDDPVYVLDQAPSLAPAVRPLHRRHALFGSSVAYVFDSGWVLRAEGTWSPDAPYSNLGGTAPLRADTYTALIGVDYQWRDWLFTAQANDRAIAGWRAQMGVPERSAVVTVSANGITHQGRMSHRIAWTALPQYGDGNWLQWRTSWQFDDRWQLEANLDLINGRQTGLLGQFRERDRLRMELRRQF